MTVETRKLGLQGIANAELDQQGREYRNEVADQIEHVLNRFQQRFTLDNPRLADRYLKAELHLVIRFRIGGVDEEFVARFEREQPIRRSDQDGGERRPEGGGVESGAVAQERQHASEHGPADIDRTETASNGEQQAVLVGVVQFLELPEEIVPSLVRIRRVDGLKGLLPDAMYFSPLVGFVLTSRLEDGVLGVPMWPIVSPADRDQVVGEVVEGSMEVVDRIASDGGDLHRDILDAGDVVNELARFRITLGADSIGLGVVERSERGIQVLDVLLGPVNFRGDAT